MRDAEGAVVIAGLLKTHPNQWETIKFSGNRLTNAGVHVICQAIVGDRNGSNGSSGSTNESSNCIELGQPPPSTSRCLKSLYLDETRLRGDRATTGIAYMLQSSNGLKMQVNSTPDLRTILRDGLS